MLTPLQKSIERGTKYNQGKRKPGRPGKSDDDRSTLESIATEYNVSERTVFNDGKFVEALDRIGEIDHDFMEDVRNDRIKVTRLTIMKMDELTVPEARKAIENIRNGKKWDAPSKPGDAAVTLLKQSQQDVHQLRSKIVEACGTHIDLQISTFQPALNELSGLLDNAIKRTSE